MKAKGRNVFRSRTERGRHGGGGGNGNPTETIPTNREETE